MNMKGKLLLLALAFLLIVAAASVACAAITTAQVERIWGDVTATASMQRLPLSVKDEKSPNAWVTSGKSVTVTTGLMQLLQTEEEMFGVLAHEAGHAKLGHYQQKVGNAVGLEILSKIIGKGLGGGVAAGAAVNTGANLASAGFSREKEVEADDFAVDIAFAAGIDPSGIHTALARMMKLGGKTEPSGFNSHPPDDRRLRHIRERIYKRDAEAVIPQVQ